MHAGDLIVFYGSLRAPFQTRERIGIESMVERVGMATFQGALHDLGPYPAFAAGNGQVFGDLYEVIDDGLATILDPFEGFDPANPEGSSYVRMSIDLISPRTQAWVYRYTGAPPQESQIAGGDWVKHLAAAGRPGTLGSDGGP